MAGFRGSLRAAGLVLLFACLALFTVTDSADAVGAEGEGWPSFNESDGCGSPWMRGPNVERSGWLSSSTVLRGPHADYFGRTIDQIWDSLHWWDVPMSNGESLRLHERLAPALERVEANLAAAASDGKYYSIVARYTYGYAARTIGGAYRVSQHALGNAIDFNSTSNPYTTGSLRTNMPSWFVDALGDAGFCWGGYWISAKDAMHYNWRGPLFTPGITELPASYPPLTGRENFSRVMYDGKVAGDLASTAYRLLMDGDNDGAIDVVNVSRTISGGVIDVLRARNGFEGCAVSRYAIGAFPAGGQAINGDWDRDGAQDLWIIEDTGGVRITAYLRYGDFGETDAVSLGIDPGDAYIAADHDVDGWTDLYVLRDGGGSWTVEVRDGASRFTTVLATGTVAAPSDTTFTALDRDRDQVPDLVGVGPSGSFIASGASGFSARESFGGVPGPFDDIAGSDFDGDGRHDLVTLHGANLRVKAGNTRLPGVAVTSWFEWPEHDCSSGDLPYPHRGTFRDDDNSVHESNIEAIAEIGITVGCNPPLRDEYCPTNDITRGQLAAFISRALDLPASSGNTYSDDDDSIFEPDIERLVAAGISVPCDDSGSRFCPRDVATRAEMAMFLTQALDLEPFEADLFVDDDGSPYEDAINAIGAVRVTRGCNPPDNDRFCPDDGVTRAAMASFMLRAIDLITP